MKTTRRQLLGCLLCARYTADRVIGWQISAHPLAIGMILCRRLSRGISVLPHCGHMHAHFVRTTELRLSGTTVGPTDFASMPPADDEATRSTILALRHELQSNVRLILASQSPRRREILDMMGLQDLYEVRPASNMDESAVQTQLRQQNLTPTQYVERLAHHKAAALVDEIFDDLSKVQGTRAMTDGALLPPTTTTLVLGSDTVVEHDGIILEKPRDRHEAKRMLTALSAAAHHVHTGVCVLTIPSDGYDCGGDGGGSNVDVVRRYSFSETALVQFAALTEADIDAYIETGEPMDKAGAYGIQGVGGQFVTSITGDFFTVMGLPMHATSVALASSVQTMRTMMEDKKQDAAAC